MISENANAVQSGFIEDHLVQTRWTQAGISRKKQEEIFVKGHRQ